MPGPRLTGLGGALFCAAVMLALGLLTEALFGASLTVYGVLFLPVSVLTALWVREGDLLIAPVVVPIAFAVGLVPVADEGGGSVPDRLMGMVTGLATQAGWLYGGTLLAGALVLVRQVRRVRRARTANRRPTPDRAGKAPVRGADKAPARRQGKAPVRGQGKASVRGQGKASVRGGKAPA
ncbi:DUF6542 domain-containing protein [Streptomyces althioticus]|uniref:DUF6542 domain-containing protein n=1 Tax=Streptomyces althioticus TaxID=83380 RepID=UPI0037A78D2B